MRNLINLMTILQASHHYTRLTSAAKADLSWWRFGLTMFHGTAPFNSDIALPSFQFATDACLIGGGAMFEGDWFYVSWLMDFPSLGEKNINVLELKTVHVAAEKWGPKWAGKHILVRSDNSATVASLNKGTSRSVDMLEIIQQIFWLSVRYGFKLSAVHLPGHLNILSDRISRMHVPAAAIEAKSLLTCDREMESVGHMSYQTFVWLQGWWETNCQP